MFFQKSGKNLSSESQIKTGIRYSMAEKKNTSNWKVFVKNVSTFSVIALIVIFTTSCGGKTSINLNNYMDISAEGYDTMGKAVISFDDERFAQDFGAELDKIVEQASTNMDGGDTFKAMYEGLNGGSIYSQYIFSLVSGDVDKKEGLCNGDVITYKWNCKDPSVLENLDIELVYSDISYTVEGLGEMEAFDPFEGIEVTFSGGNGDGHAKIEGTPVASEAAEFGYRIDSSSTSLSNGDVIVVAAYIQSESDPVQYCIDKYGKMPNALKKEYTVSGLTSYISSASEINEDSLEKMKAKALEVYNEENVSQFYEGDTLADFEYVGNYFLNCKNDYGTRNACYLIFNITVNHEDTTYGETSKFCWYISFRDLVIGEDNKIMSTHEEDYYSDSNDTEGRYGVTDDYPYDGGWYYYGSLDIDDIYQTVTEDNLRDYDVEVNIIEELAMHLESEEDLEDYLYYYTPFNTEWLQ